jgi:large subunit ribosomal protein L21
MYAIIEDSGRQFKVAEGERIDVDLRAANAGDTLEFNRVLFLGGETPTVGAPYVENARVKGQVEAEVKARKLISYKYTRREQYHRKVGHRQRQLRVRITEIVVPPK